MKRPTGTYKLLTYDTAKIIGNIHVHFKDFKKQSTIHFYFLNGEVWVKTVRWGRRANPWQRGRATHLNSRPLRVDYE